MAKGLRACVLRRGEVYPIIRMAPERNGERAEDRRRKNWEQIRETRPGVCGANGAPGPGNRQAPKTLLMFTMAGPRITTKMAGKMKKTRGNRSLTVVFAARSSAA